MSAGIKKLAALLLAGSSVPAVPVTAGAESVYPQRPITVVVGFPPGGASDLIARHMAAYMTEELGKKVIVENRTGAAGNLAAADVARAAPDGYTLYLAARPNTTHKVMYPAIEYDFARDLTPVAMLASVPLVMVAPQQSPVHDLPGLIAAAKTRPGKLVCGSAGVGSTEHLLCEVFKKSAGVDIVHVAYRGSAPALVDLMAGRTDIQITLVPGVIAQIKSGAVRPIVVMASGRIAALPDVPAIEEYQLPGKEGGTWYALVAPQGTPADVITRLNRSVNTVLRDATLRHVMEDLAFTLPESDNTPEEMRAFIDQEIERWTAVLHDRGIEAPR
ncbi:tripartite tricarboxylate transporter substrate binding protein [Bordetella sp. LUAb4]|uniref:Bug family tripartite tricarboxylate transporter substrate binding protein n=1 Tax=Bordetella sp. LUAb4 TaxID=2843195 RepID=UPI001E3C4F37|nr:tripartite tricarboxylate transporter substrate-binding protein [Bordetella sp. LUAb4]